LLVSGFIVGWLFLINISFLWRQVRGAFYLLFGLAMFDIVGEFVAQGTLFIDMMLSFMVALAIVLILLAYRTRFFSSDLS
ncbi:MAG: hypothetical protein KAT29_15375, partial [Anaerolineales bacterium]|nr:hypothetical protein [Anaerolineales bacterium]